MRFHDRSLSLFVAYDRGSAAGAKREIAAASGGDEATTWRVRLFAGHRAGERSLRAGDCVTLFHSECEAALMYQRMTSAGLAKAAMGGFVDSVFLHKATAGDDAAAAAAAAANMGTVATTKNTNGLWQIVALDETHGGNADWGERYRIRHVATGRYIAAQRVGGAGAGGAGGAAAPAANPFAAALSGKGKSLGSRLGTSKVLRNT